MDKNPFIIRFIEGVIDAAHGLKSLGNISYKGFRPNIFYKNRSDYHGFKNLERRKIIKVIDDRFRFTKEGLGWLKTAQARYFKNRYRVWDKKWRIVIFDIPQELHRERNRLRRKLKMMNFHMMQKSVFVFPYPCEEELAEVCQKLRLSDYIDIITAESAGFKTEELLKI